MTGQHVDALEDGEPSDAVTQAVTSVREFVTGHQAWLVGTGRMRWHQVCACMDAIEDTDLAITAYCESPFPRTAGQRYLVVYGLLQAMYVQQDAVLALAGGLPDECRPHFDFKDYAELRRIRDVRNLSVGHPSLSGKGRGDLRHGFITRISLAKRGFSLLIESQSGERPGSLDVDLFDLIRVQRSTLAGVIRQILDCLLAADRAHRRRHREPLAPALAAAGEAALAALAEAACDNCQASELGDIAKQLSAALAAFRQALAARHLDVGRLFGLEDLVRETALAVYLVRAIRWPSQSYRRASPERGRGALSRALREILARFLALAMERLVAAGPAFAAPSAMSDSGDDHPLHGSLPYLARRFGYAGDLAALDVVRSGVERLTDWTRQEPVSMSLPAAFRIDLALAGDTLDLITASIAGEPPGPRVLPYVVSFVFKYWGHLVEFAASLDAEYARDD